MVMVMMMVVVCGMRRYRRSGENCQTEQRKHQIPKLHGRSPLSRHRLPLPAAVNV